MSKEEMKKWIDNASYGQLLSKWRYAPMGDPFFQGEIGDYYELKMKEKKSQIDIAEQVRMSKIIGWD